MKFIIEVYFLLFRWISSKPNIKYMRSRFHLWGSLSFLISAHKHLKRRNKELFVVNVFAMFKQWYYSYCYLLYPGRANYE